MAVECATFLASVCCPLNEIGESLYLTLDELGYRLIGALQRLRALLLNSEQVLRPAPIASIWPNLSEGEQGVSRGNL